MLVERELIGGPFDGAKTRCGSTVSLVSFPKPGPVCSVTHPAPDAPPPPFGKVQYRVGKDGRLYYAED